MWFGAWRGDSLTRPRLDISHPRLACGGEILLHAPAEHILSSFGAWWGDSLTRPRLELSHHCLAHGGEILLLAAGWASLLIQRVVGRFSYLPQAGHILSSFGTWWGDSLTHPRLYISRGSVRGGEILTHPRLDISYCLSTRGGEILLLTPGLTSLVVVWHVVGRFSYRLSVHGGKILLLTQGWTSLIIVQRMVGRFSYLPLAGYLIMVRHMVERFLPAPGTTPLVAVWRSSFITPPSTEPQQEMSSQG